MGLILSKQAPEPAEACTEVGLDPTIGEEDFGLLRGLLSAAAITAVVAVIAIVAFAVWVMP